MTEREHYIRNCVGKISVCIFPFQVFIMRMDNERLKMFIDDGLIESEIEFREATTPEKKLWYERIEDRERETDIGVFFNKESYNELVYGHSIQTV